MVCDGDQQAVRAPFGPQALVAELQLRHRYADCLRLAGVVGRVVLVAVVAGTVDALPQKVGMATMSNGLFPFGSTVATSG